MTRRSFFAIKRTERTRESERKRDREEKKRDASKRLSERTKESNKLHTPFVLECLEFEIIVICHCVRVVSFVDNFINFFFHVLMCLGKMFLL